MRVVVVTPVVVFVVVVVVTVGPAPPMTMAVNALTAGGGVVVAPATVDPLGWPEAFPPASADWPHTPAAISSRGRAAMRIERAITCLRDFMMVQP